MIFDPFQFFIVWCQMNGEPVIRVTRGRKSCYLSLMRPLFFSAIYQMQYLQLLKAVIEFFFPLKLMVTRLSELPGNYHRKSLLCIKMLHTKLLGWYKLIWLHEKTT